MTRADDSALVLRHVDGLSYEEIAEALERPTGTVKAQVHRGIALLRIAFSAEDATEAPPTTNQPPAALPQEALR